MRGICIGSLVVMAILAGCSSEPGIPQREIARLHTVKVVYLPPPHNLGVYSYPNQGAAATNPDQIPVAMVANLVISARGPSFGDDETKNYLNSYQDAIAKLDTRKRLYDTVTGALALAPWLAKVPVEVRDQPMSGGDVWRYIHDTGVDAILYFMPTVGLEDTGRYLHLYVICIMYVNPHTASPYIYGEVSYGGVYSLVVPHQDPKKPPKSIYALNPQQAIGDWFMDDAAELRGDIDPVLPEIGESLALYLGGHAKPQTSR